MISIFQVIQTLDCSAVSGIVRSQTCNKSCAIRKWDLPGKINRCIARYGIIVIDPIDIISHFRGLRSTIKIRIFSFSIFPLVLRNNAIDVLLQKPKESDPEELIWMLNSYRTMKFFYTGILILWFPMGNGQAGSKIICRALQNFSAF